MTNVSITAMQRRLSPLGRPWLFALLVLPALPLLLFSAYLPTWVPQAALGYLLVLFLLYSAAAGRLIGHTPADPALWLLLLILPVGLWASADLAATLPRTYAFVANLALFLAIAVQRNTRWLPWSGWLLLLAGLSLGLFLLPGTRFGTTKLPFIGQDIFTLLPAGFRPFWNPAGFNANLTGGILALFLPPAIMLALAAPSWLQKMAALFTALVLLALLLLAQSRGALIGVAIAIPLITSLYNRRWAWFWWGALLLAAVALILLRPALSTDLLFGQSDVFSADTLTGRVELWSRAIYMAQDFAFTGVGLGMFEPVTKLLYPTFLTSPDSIFLHPHNIYLQAVTEMGFPGLVAHVALFVTLGVVLYRQGDNRSTGYNRVLALGLFGSLIVFLVHGLFEVIIYAPRAAIVVWGLFGLMMAVGLSGRGREQVAGE